MRPNDKRAQNVIALIWIVLVLEIAALISGYFQYKLIQTAANGGEISMLSAQANDLREQIISIVYTIVYIISAVAFIQWFRRAYYNLHQRVDYLSHAEGWAAGSWFVPVVNFYRPYQIMNELYRETYGLITKQGIAIDTNIRTGSLGIWWTLWIVNGLIGQFVFRYSINAVSIDELTTLSVAGMISNLVGIPLAIITVKVIRDYANYEPLLIELNDEKDPET